jgi:hypothetical protein
MARSSGQTFRIVDKTTGKVATSTGPGYIANESMEIGVAAPTATAAAGS